MISKRVFENQLQALERQREEQYNHYESWSEARKGLSSGESDRSLAIGFGPKIPTAPMEALISL